MANAEGVSSAEPEERGTRPLASPHPLRKQFMQRHTVYHTSDQQRFPSRGAAWKHETNLVRQQCILEYLAAKLPSETPVSVAAVAAAIMADPKEFARRLSARAARRRLGATQSPASQ